MFAGRLATTASGFCAITFLLIDGMHGEARMATYFNSFNCFYVRCGAAFDRSRPCPR